MRQHRESPEPTDSTRPAPVAPRRGPGLLVLQRAAVASLFGPPAGRAEPEIAAGQERIAQAVAGKARTELTRSGE
jgi:hypothetical protein